MCCCVVIQRLKYLEQRLLFACIFVPPCWTRFPVSPPLPLSIPPSSRASPLPLLDLCFLFPFFGIVICILFFLVYNSVSLGPFSRACVCVVGGFLQCLAPFSPQPPAGWRWATRRGFQPQHRASWNLRDGVCWRRQWLVFPAVSVFLPPASYFSPLVFPGWRWELWWWWLVASTLSVCPGIKPSGMALGWNHGGETCVRWGFFVVL